ncbi:UNVERIFIED_CONTAM: putative ribonuclease H protein [Sesamum radiatum]|uniref:Ribonuclease H protein n=1 Tax=Sesamum radiatum TaxID=300843 RepID=A0AAW2J046_SESRA
MTFSSFCKADVQSVSLFRRGLDLFASLSGLRTNPQKSHLIISKATSGLQDSLLEALGFQEATYLLGTLVCHLFQHGSLSQIVNHCYRKLTAALRDGRSPALLCRTGATYQICFGFLRGLLGYGIYFAKRNAIRDGSSNVVGHPRLWEILWLKSSDKGSLAFNYDSLLAHSDCTDYGKSLGLSRSQRAINLSFLRDSIKHSLTQEEADLISAPVTQSEIKEALFDIDEDSAPGPDGYTSAFFKDAWPVVGEEVSAAVTEFFRTGKLLKQINATLLVLIPKVQLPSQVSDYRPIACCNVLYKTITKIIVKRMQLILHQLIDYSQNAFVPGRSISDNILLAQELLAGYNHAKLPPRCTIKLDLKKAYDSVEWDFLSEVLKLFNFPPTFVGWIVQCVSTASFSISLNGSIYGFFPGARGLRQGDPMSPYLFVLVMEIWNTLLRYRVQNAPQFQHHWKCKELNILNICFADDVLLFCKAHLPSATVIKDALSEFSSLSGLNVNPAKSQIILSRAAQQNKQQLLELLGFQEGFLPVKYLGVPLTSSRLTVADCRPLINTLESRLEGWKQLSLSFAGRALLIKSVLSTLHAYWALVFILPKGIIELIEAKIRKFLWQGSTGCGYAKVSWEQICKPKEEGGLGFRTIITMNQALMLKHLWRLIQLDRSSIWVDWILQYRLRNSSLWSYTGATGSWGWKKMLKLRPLLRCGLTYRVGNGDSFKLWKDIWHENGPLCLSYPRGPTTTGLPLDAPLSCVIQKWSMAVARPHRSGYKRHCCPPTSYSSK